ncbi:MAG: CHAT domain-containing protein [Leptolyngbyaceae bacterium]|nr:CHAT domain-containing protein [Leptolyngbyaceae bacterium]
MTSLTFCLWLGHDWTQESSHAVEPRAEASNRPSASQRVQQGVIEYQMGNFQAAIALWETALDSYETSGNLTHQAIVIENLARAHRALGNADAALHRWEQVTRIYEQLGNVEKVGRMLTEQAQTYTSLGQYRQAIARLCSVAFTAAEEEGEVDVHPSSCLPTSALGIALANNDVRGAAAALGSLGEAYRLQGDYTIAIGALQQSRAIAETLDNSTYWAAALNGLGSVYARQSQISDRLAEDADERGDMADAGRLRSEALEANANALIHFQQAYNIAKEDNNLRDQIQGMLNLIPAYHRSGSLSDTQAFHSGAIALLPQLPNTRDKVYTAIDLATLLPLTQSLDARRGSLSSATCLAPEIRPDAQALLGEAMTVAQQIGDNRALSFAAGKLGQVYECEELYEDALTFTHAAELAADQEMRSPDSLYLWQWQTGRILNRQNEPEKAILAYEEAISTLEKIRSDILISDRDIQFDFRDAVEPVYRELAKLRLAQAPVSETVTAQDNQETTQNITSALIAIDSLKLAELQNYFGDECLILASIDPDESKTVVDTRDDRTGVFSTFISDNQTSMILTLPNQQQRIEVWEQSDHEINQIVTSFRLGLEESLYRLEDYDLTQSQDLYDRLIRPFVPDLERFEIETLVFVQDGLFRSIPMAALHDGEQYLIERYAIATTPSLLLTSVPPPPRRRNLKALALGLSASAVVDGQEFRALSGVPQELSSIKEQLPGSQSLLNEEFTSDRLRQALREEDFSIIHLATHGEFGAEPENTFLVTGDQQKLTIRQLEEAIRQAGGTRQVDLLTLTACKTGVGDSRSTLGLAGVAVQAGSRSAIASLWSISDESTAQLMSKFYGELRNPTNSKAEALGIAQRSFIHNEDRFLSRPGFWAPFTLIGDWR